MKKKEAKNGGSSEYRIAVVGAVQCGKSTLVNQYFDFTYIEEYDPTILHSFSKMVSFSFRAFPFGGIPELLHFQADQFLNE